MLWPYIPLQLLWREWKLPGLGKRPSLLSQRGGLSQWAGCESQREEDWLVEKGQLWWPGLEDNARTLPMWGNTFCKTQSKKGERYYLIVIFIVIQFLKCSTLYSGSIMIWTNLNTSFFKKILLLKLQLIFDMLFSEHQIKVNIFISGNIKSVS